jgi:hypothetical protein
LSLLISTRVTRLGEFFVLFGDCFLWADFLKIAEASQIWGHFLLIMKSRIFCIIKSGWANFFINSSVRPDERVLLIGEDNS